jgi:hypothetical protein
MIPRKTRIASSHSFAVTYDDYELLSANEVSSEVYPPTGNCVTLSFDGRLWLCEAPFYGSNYIDLPKLIDIQRDVIAHWRLESDGFVLSGGEWELHVGDYILCVGLGGRVSLRGNNGLHIRLDGVKTYEDVIKLVEFIKGK